MNTDRRVKLGTVSVDTGRLLLADPVYLNSEAVSSLEDVLLGQRTSAPVVSGRGLMFSSGFGDGTYSVYATVGKVPDAGDDRDVVKRVEIVLVADEDDFGDILADELVMQADAAESDPALMGSALAAYAQSQGWSRDELANMSRVSPLDLAALYCEPRPVVTITPGGGVFTEDGQVAGVMGRFAEEPDRLVEAYNEGAAIFAQRDR